MNYQHPFNNKEYEVTIGTTLMYNYITYKLEEEAYETFIYDTEENNKLLPIVNIIVPTKTTEATDKGLSIITHSKQDTESLWEELNYVGSNKLVKEFGKYLSEDADLNNKSMDYWVDLAEKKLNDK